MRFAAATNGNSVGRGTVVAAPRAFFCSPLSPLLPWLLWLLPGAALSSHELADATNSRADKDAGLLDAACDMTHRTALQRQSSSAANRFISSQGRRKEVGHL
jgi:hypothetical protein